jgi:L-glutamine-phosphate cytidylyltransferase
LLVVTGYRSDQIKALKVPCVHNGEFSSTNMVWSLYQSLPYLVGLRQKYVYLSYGDIVLCRESIDALEHSSGDFNVVVDVLWESLWSLRMNDYLNDVETLKMDGARIFELGQKPESMSDINGQYIGVMKVKRELLIQLLNDYKRMLDRAIAEDQVKIKNMYMTDFIQNYIETGGYVTSVLIEGGWLEVDTLEDLRVYDAHFKTNILFSKLQ